MRWSETSHIKGFTAEPNGVEQGRCCSFHGGVVLVYWTFSCKPLWALTLTPRLSERFKGSWSFQFTLFTCKLLHWHADPADLCLAPLVTFSGWMSYFDSITANLIDSWGDSRVTQILRITKKPRWIFECRSCPRDKRDLQELLLA